MTGGESGVDHVSGSGGSEGGKDGTTAGSYGISGDAGAPTTSSICVFDQSAFNSGCVFDN